MRKFRPTDALLFLFIAIALMLYGCSARGGDDMQLLLGYMRTTCAGPITVNPPDGNKLLTWSCAKAKRDDNLYPFESEIVRPPFGTASGIMDNDL